MEIIAALWKDGKLRKLYSCFIMKHCQQESLQLLLFFTPYQFIMLCISSQEEQRSDQRKKNLLILVLHHLLQEGYSESAKALESESSMCFNRFEVCDNVDLETVLMVSLNGQLGENM